METTTDETTTVVNAVAEAKVRVGVWALTGNPQGSWERLVRDLEFLAGTLRATLTPKPEAKDTK